MGRLVCFTDNEGQSGTCLDMDEDCDTCDFAPKLVRQFRRGELSYCCAEFHLQLPLEEIPPSNSQLFSCGRIVRVSSDSLDDYKDLWGGAKA